MLEITRESVKLAVMEGLREYDEKRQEQIERMCEKNVEIALQKHEIHCPASRKGNLSGLSGLGLGICLTIRELYTLFYGSK